MHDLEPSYQQQYPSAPGGEGMPMSGGRLMVEPEGLGLRECIRLLRKHLQLITLCFIGSLLVTAVIITTDTSNVHGQGHAADRAQHTASPEFSGGLG
jgi:hypothetical protein